VLQQELWNISQGVHGVNCTTTRPTRASYSLMLGTGKYSSHGDYTGDITTVVQHIYHLVLFVWANKQFLASDNNCRRCTNWETSGDHTLLWTPIPKNYSQDILQDDKLCLTTKKLTYVMLKVRVLSSHANVAGGD